MSGAHARAAARWREAGAILLVLALCGGFFWQALTLRGVFFHYDHAIQNYPYRLFFAEGLRQGRLRLWTPDIFCGFPLFAESQGNALYPLFLLLFRLLPTWIAYNYYHILHFMLAGAGAYVLARIMRISRPGAVLAGLCYMFSGPVLYHAHHTNIVVGVAYLPWLLALMELGFRRSLRWLLAFSAATGALVLGAQPQYTLYCAVVCGLYLLWRLRLLEVSGKNPRHVLRLGLLFGGAALLGGMLAAAQLLPLAELTRHTSRAVAAGKMPRVSPGIPGNLMTVLMPHYFGSPGLGSYWGQAGPGIYSELTLFMGVAPLLLAMVAVTTDRSRRTVALAGLGAFAFIFSLGYCGSLYQVIGLMPVFRATRYPQRFAFVTALCVALLAGVGLDRLTASEGRERARRAALASAALLLVLCTVQLCVVAAYQGPFARLSRAELAAALPLSEFHLEVMWRHLHHTLPADVWRLVIVAVGGTALCVACAGGRLRGRLSAALWIALAFGGLAFAGRDFNAVTDPAIYLRPPELARFLESLPPGRIFRYRYYDARLPAVPGDFPQRRGWALKPSVMAHSLDRLPHNANMTWGIPSVAGFSPLQPLALKTLLGKPENTSTLIEYDISTALDLLGARYILTPHENIPGGFKRIARVGATYVFENPRAMPRAFVVHRAAPAPDGAAAARMLRDGEFDFRQAALIHGAGPDLLRLDPGAAGPNEYAEIAADEGDSLTVRARLDRPGYLVLADEYYPGWRASVDGKPAGLLRADYLLRAVRLGPGEHVVRFEFRPASFRAGAWLSLLATVGLGVGVALALTVRTRRAPPEPRDLLFTRCAPRTPRKIFLVAAVFVALGPVLRANLWRQIRFELDPRTYVWSTTRVVAAYWAADGDIPRAYEELRKAFLFWPADPKERRVFANAGALATIKLIADGETDRARAVARDVMRLVPEEARLLAPAICGVAREPSPRGESP